MQSDRAKTGSEKADALRRSTIVLPSSLHSRYCIVRSAPPGVLCKPIMDSMRFAGFRGTALLVAAMVPSHSFVRRRSCEVRRDLGCHEIHEQPRAERWCSAESVEEMQGYALKLSLGQDDLQVPGVDIRFDRTAQEVGDANTIERRHPEREAAVEIETTMG